MSPEKLIVLSEPEIERLYRKRARYYDWTANLYYLIGFREWAYRKRTVQALRLRPGDTVVEIGCGTGLNFSLLQRAVGPNGKIIGVDLTPQMLDQARARIRRHGWSNVQLAQCDAADYRFPQKLDGAMSFCAITLMTEYDAIIRNGAEALSPGKRFVIFDLKEPRYAPEWLMKLAVGIERPFGVERELAARHPWESFPKYLNHTVVNPVYFGFAYIAVGEARAS